MEPVTALAVEYVKGKLVERVAGGFKTHVIERWTKHRASAYFEQLCIAVADQADVGELDELDELLDKILQNEASSQVLFDAYRSVCFTRSKEVGPRVLAILTAELVMTKREAGWSEDALFWAAENMDDMEFRGFAEFFDEHLDRAKNPPENPGPYATIVVMGQNGDHMDIRWHYEQFDSNRGQPAAVSVGPLDLNESFGSWAAKLKTSGILSDDVRERNWEYREDSEAYLDEDGSVREVSWWIGLGPTAFRLRALLSRLNPSGG